MAIKLGETVTDSITGLKGIAVVRAEFLYGCVRIGVQPVDLKDGARLKIEDFDELQLLENDPATTPPLHFILGLLVTDAISGFKGVAYMRSENLYSAARVLVQPKKLGKDGLPIEPLAFDEGQLIYKVEKAIQKKILPPVTAKTGGPGHMPGRPALPGR